MLDYLCDECREHFEKVKSYLDALMIDYVVNPHIVRGLDYYTKTVFEFVSHNDKTDGLVCGGGGRYDGLIEELGGQHTPSLGFAMGLERLLSVIEAQGIELPGDQKCDIYIGSIGDAASLVAAKLCTDLRSDGVSAQFDVAGRSVKAQMKYADNWARASPALSATTISPRAKSSSRTWKTAKRPLSQSKTSAMNSRRLSFRLRQTPLRTASTTEISTLPIYQISLEGSDNGENLHCGHQK